MSAIRGQDLAARVGGDEFAVLAVDLPDDSDGLYRRLHREPAAARVSTTLACARRSETGDPLSHTATTPPGLPALSVIANRVAARLRLARPTPLAHRL